MPSADMVEADSNTINKTRIHSLLVIKEEAITTTNKTMVMMVVMVNNNRTDKITKDSEEDINLIDHLPDKATNNNTKHHPCMDKRKK